MSATATLVSTRSGRSALVVIAQRADDIDTDRRSRGGNAEQIAARLQRVRS
jgi:hypothetical protein